jgi:hypothetical protein
MVAGKVPGHVEGAESADGDVVLTRRRGDAEEDAEKTVARIKT